MRQEAYIWDESKQKFKLVVIADYTPYVKENYFQRMQTDNGFSKKRTLRKIGSIPIDVLISMKEKGYEILRDGKKLKKFLKEHPEFRTCGGNI